MKSWTSSLSRTLAASILGVALFQGCGGTKSAIGNASSRPLHPPILVFPLENLAEVPVPLVNFRESMVRKLRRKGVGLGDDETMEKFLARHRVRYTGGIDSGKARALKEETGAGAVLLTSIGLYSELVPPKVSVSSRLVSTESLQILWMESVTLSGDDSPGILGLGLINDSKVLLDLATEQLTESLSRHLSGLRTGAPGERKKRKYLPETEYRSHAYGPDFKPYVLSFSLPESRGEKRAGAARLEVFLKPPSERVVTVDYGVRGGSAKGSGVDYRLASGTLIFSPGETKKTIGIEIVGNAPGEEDKTVEIGLFAPENAILGGCQRHTYTILGRREKSTDPLPGKRILPGVTFDRTSQTVTEGVCGVAARMVLTFVTEWDVAVPFEFGGTARTPEDFKSPTRSPLVIRAGAQSSSIVIALADNDRTQEDRTLEVSMGTPANASPSAARKQAITIMDDDRKRAIAVIPFFNQTTRKNAGEMVSLHFLRHLVEAGGFRIVEPGEIREQLLDLRVIMEEGISLANADDLFRKLDADLILTGRVLDYQDTLSGGGVPIVDFSVLVLERKGKSVIWHSRSRNRGDDGVFFFNFGVVRTSDGLASQMAGAVVDHMLN